MIAWYLGLAQPSRSYTAPPTISMPIAPETKTVPAATKKKPIRRGSERSKGTNAMPTTRTIGMPTIIQANRK